MAIRWIIVLLVVIGLEEQSKHINELELRAAFFTLLSFCGHLSEVHIRLMMDNTTAIACVNNFGSMKFDGSY